MMGKGGGGKMRNFGLRHDERKLPAVIFGTLSSRLLLLYSLFTRLVSSIWICLFHFGYRRS